MCVIMHFAAGAMMNKDKFFNAVWNNPHGYGLILRDSNNKIQLLKGFNEEGTDPEVLWKLINDNKDIERFLHVRWATKGGTDESNVQPFPVFSSNNREIFFMHNGTLSSFGNSSYYNNGHGGYYRVTENDGRSDTRHFCEEILTPALSHWSGENGLGDYNSEGFYKLIVDKHWSTGSTGLFISNDLAPRRIGTGWSEFNHPSDDETSNGVIWVSNTSYFDRCQRGFHFQRIEAERKAKEEAQKALTTTTKTYQKDVDDSIPFLYDDPNRPLKFSPAVFTKSAKVLSAIEEIVNKWDFSDEKNVAALSNATYEEWVSFVEDENEYTIAALIEELVEKYREIFFKNRDLTSEKKRAEQHIIKMKKEMKNATEKAA